MPAPVTTTQITAIRDVAPEVQEFTLAPAEPVAFQPGQWISLQLPVGERPPLVRAYSFAAPHSASGEIVLCLDRVPGGLGSKYLFGLGPGDEVTCGAVLGSFVLPDGPTDMLWMARFTGIVPFRAMLLSLRERREPPTKRITLLYSGASPDALPYLNELQQAAAALSWFELIATVDAPSPEWVGEARAALDLLPELVGERKDMVPMVCGTREFVRPIRDYFYELGFERRDVKWENYD